MNMTTEQADTMNERLMLINLTLHELRSALEGIRLTNLPVYTTEEAAALLHTSPARISELRQDGILRGKKSGKGYIFSRPDLIDSISIRRIDWEGRPEE